MTRQHASLLATRIGCVPLTLSENRKILGHKSDHVTTHYAAPEIGALIEASELWRGCAS
jgi:predicted short-subunit dehydrogenase-like oxidoreductase (DUF2520 family)